jgi:hypothetical protein
MAEHIRDIKENTSTISTNLSDLPPTIRSWTARYKMKLYIRKVCAAVGKLCGHPGQALKQGDV